MARSPFSWEREWTRHHWPYGHNGGPLGGKSIWPEKPDLGRARGQPREEQEVLRLCPAQRAPAREEATAWGWFSLLPTGCPRVNLDGKETGVEAEVPGSGQKGRKGGQPSMWVRGTDHIKKKGERKGETELDRDGEKITGIKREKPTVRLRTGRRREGEGNCSLPLVPHLDTASERHREPQNQEQREERELGTERERVREKVAIKARWIQSKAESEGERQPERL